MSVSYLLQIREDINGIHLTTLDCDLDEKTQINPPHVTTNLEQLELSILAPINLKNDSIGGIQFQSNEDQICQVVQQNQMNPQPTKKGRKKKKKNEEPKEVKEEPVKILKPAPRTRSGRVVKFPKHMEKDFKKVETNDMKKTIEKDEEFETTDFAIFKEEPPSKIQNMQQLDFHQRKRKIAAQYRCPKCLKAYLGKTKMIQHIKKYPDHGPLPQDCNKMNFDVWNYLVDITQKCSPAQRGIKFCEELTNLLHNVLLLTSALFKKVEHNKNFVEVDKVLGNAIGLSPGFYTFNDSELYKDVTVLKLITTTDFFKPVDPNEPQNDKSKIACPEEKDTREVVKNNCSGESAKVQTKEMVDVYFNTHEDSSKTPHNYCISQIEPRIVTDLEDMPDDFEKKDNNSHIDSELLSDHAIMHLSNIRSSVDELMLTSVDPGGTLLDNSTSSDEVMNVDQFVNERFKKITEPDLELGPSSLNLSSLNLDLPSLELFQFHTT